MRRLTNWLDSYVRYTKMSEAPHAFHLWSGLWALSAAVSRKAWMDFGFFTLYPNLFVVLTGPPASRKTTAALIANRLIDQVEGLEMGPDIASKEYLIQHIAQNATTFPYKGEDHIHCSSSVLSTEWSTFMGAKDMELCNVLCKLYDCDEKFKKGTKTQGSDRLENVFLSLLGCSTSKQIGDCLPQASIGGGFTSRIIFIVGDEEIAKRNPIPVLSVRELELKRDLVHDLQQINEDVVGPFKFSRGGHAFYTDWYMARNEQLKIDEKFHHYCDRKPVHVTKVAMLLAVARRNDMVIGAGEVKDAIEMLAAIEPRMPEALGGVGLSLTSPIIAAVMNHIRLNETITKRKLQTLMWRDANKEELDMALFTLAGMDVPIKADIDGTYHWMGGK